MSKETNKIVFAVYPNANGFGFVYMENARKLIDFGAVRINPISNRRVIERIRRSINYLRPSIVIVQDPESKSSRTGRRVKQVIKNVLVLAEELKLKTEQYSRDQIREVLEQFGATTKYEISQVLIKEFVELERKLPKKRELWTSEDRNMAIFDALSLALTWFYIHE
jgi:NAD-dependent DNA ligase